MLELDCEGEATGAQNAGAFEQNFLHDGNGQD